MWGLQLPAASFEQVRTGGLQQRGPLPGVCEAVAVKDPEDSADGKQDGFIKWTRDRQKPESRAPPERSWDAVVAKNELHRSNGPASKRTRLLHGLSLGRDPGSGPRRPRLLASRVPVAETIEYHVHYDDGSSITMPFSRRLEGGDTWQDTIAEWPARRAEPWAGAESAADYVTTPDRERAAQRTSPAPTR
jgi:hypothetical protein